MQARFGNAAFPAAENRETDFQQNSERTGSKSTCSRDLGRSLSDDETCYEKTEFRILELKLGDISLWSPRRARAKACQLLGSCNSRPPLRCARQREVEKRAASAHETPLPVALPREVSQ